MSSKGHSHIDGLPGGDRHVHQGRFLAEHIIRAKQDLPRRSPRDDLPVLEPLDHGVDEIGRDLRLRVRSREPGTGVIRRDRTGPLFELFPDLYFVVIESVGASSRSVCELLSQTASAPYC